MRNTTTGLLSMVILIFALSVWADALDDALPATVNERVRTHTREMIQADLPMDDAVKMTRITTQYQFRNERALQAQGEVIDARVMRAGRQATLPERLPAGR